MILFGLFKNHSDNEEIVEPLLTAGANVNAKNKKGTTPLMVTAAKGHQKVMKMFLKCSNVDLQLQVNNQKVNHTITTDIFMCRTKMETQPFTMQYLKKKWSALHCCWKMVQFQPLEMKRALLQCMRLPNEGMYRKFLAQFII